MSALRASDPGRQLLRRGAGIAELQAFHARLDELKRFDQDVFRNVTYFLSEVGELAQVLRRVRAESVASGSEARAMEMHRGALGDELADCLAYLLKLANYMGVDLETAYVEKMRRNVERSWPGAGSEA